MSFTWARRAPNSYEVSSKGDKSFSALYARMPDNRTIEMHYQCDVKGYDIGGTDWRKGKGKPPKISIQKEDMYPAYLLLWKRYFNHRPQLILNLLKHLRENNISVITDCFASSDVNQARAIADCLNELVKSGY